MANKKTPPSNISINLKAEPNQIPGDKSLSIRALLFSAWGYGISNIYNLGNGQDVRTSLRAIQRLGIKVFKNKNFYKVFGLGIGYPESKKKITLDMGNSGTSTRLIMGQLIGSEINEVKLIGDQSLSSRPLRVVEHLREFSGLLEAKKNNYLPAKIQGSPYTVQTEIKDLKPSAQIISSLILSAMNAFGTSKLTVSNEARDHTELLLKHLKYPIKIKNYNKYKVIEVQGKKYLKPLGDYHVAGDPSSSAFLIALAVLCNNSSVILKKILLNKYRIGFIKVLKSMGANIKIKNQKKYFGELVGDIHAAYSPNLKGVKINKEDIPKIIDEIPILMVCASFAKGETYFPNLEELRIKETDRLKAMDENLKLCGVNTKVVKDSMTIHGLNETYYQSKVPTIKTHLDHRIALSFYVFGCASRKKILIDNMSCAAVSFPDFEKIIQKNKKKNNKIIIAIDGGVGVGKTSICKSIVKKIGSKSYFLDSGLLYRVLAYLHLKSKKKKFNVPYLVKKADEIKIQDLKNKKLHDNEVSKIVSQIAKIKSIRDALLPVQRKFLLNAEQEIIICGGRDIASKVAPFADLKLFISAPIQVCAKRRYLELKRNYPKKTFNFSEVLKETVERQKRDTTRKHSPLIKTQDSILISNSKEGMTSAINKIMMLIRKVKQTN